MSRCARYASPILVAALGAGCNSVKNGWLQPNIVGNFTESRTTSIRTALTIEDSPSAIPGAGDPTPEDLIPLVREYPISSGDALAVEIDELRQQFAPYQAQVLVNELGQINLPVVGRMEVAGLTPRQVEEHIRQALKDEQVLEHAEVLVNPLSLKEATAWIFGIGVSAAANAPLRAGPFRITSPDMRLLEAINLVGGLNEFVTEVYVFRDDRPYRDLPEPAGGAPPSNDTPGSKTPGSIEFAPVSRKSSSDSANPDSPSGPDGSWRSMSVEPRSQREPSSPPQRRLASQPADPKTDEKINPRASAPAFTSQPIEDLERELFLAVVQTNETEASGQDVEALQDPAEDHQAPVDTAYIFDRESGTFIPNPARAKGSPIQEPPSPVEQIPLFKSLQGGIDWDRVAGEVEYRILRIPADALRTGDPYYNVVVRSRDVIRIVSGEIGVYYVMGQVARTGPFTFNTEQVTLKAAIAAAGGLTPLAWPSKCTVYRRNGLRESMIQINLDDVFAGKADDVVIRRGDIINVGTSPAAPFLQLLRSWTLPGPAATVGYGFTYSRNFADIDSYGSQPNPATQPSRFQGLFPG